MAFVASLDVETAFDVAKLSVHGHVVVDVTGSACFENFEIRQGGVEALVLWGRVAKYMLWKADEKWEARGWGFAFVREGDDEHLCRGMMWADNCCSATTQKRWCAW